MSKNVNRSHTTPKSMPLRDCTRTRQSLENQRASHPATYKDPATALPKVTTHNPYSVNVLGMALDDEHLAGPYSSQGIQADRMPSSRPVPVMPAGGQKPEIYYPTQHYYYPGSASTPMAFGALSRVYQNGRPVPVLAATGKPLIATQSWVDGRGDSPVSHCE